MGYGFSELSAAYLESASGDDEPANSHSVFNFGSPDGGLLRGRNALPHANKSMGRTTSAIRAADGWCGSPCQWLGLF